MPPASQWNLTGRREASASVPQQHLHTLFAGGDHQIRLAIQIKVRHRHGLSKV